MTPEAHKNKSEKIKAARGEHSLRAEGFTLKGTQHEARRAAKERFVRDILIRGKAVKPAKKRSGVSRVGGNAARGQAQGKDLPPGVTHEIVKDDGKNLPTIRRRRFSIT